MASKWLAIKTRFKLFWNDYQESGSKYLKCHSLPSFYYFKIRNSQKIMILSKQTLQSFPEGKNECRCSFLCTKMWFAFIGGTSSSAWHGVELRLSLFDGMVSMVCTLDKFWNLNFRLRIQLTLANDQKWPLCNFHIFHIWLEKVH